MKKILLLLFVCFTLPAIAQDVQWSFNVMAYSSEKSTKEYASTQVLGMPNVMPAGMHNINAWEAKDNTDEAYIKVGFLTPIFPKQIIISESYHPGFISKVLAYDSLGNEFVVATFTPKSIKATSRVLQLNTAYIKVKIVAVKLFLKCDKDLPFAIDAIGIASSDKLYKMHKKEHDLVKSNMVAKKLDTTVNSIFREMGPLVSPDGKTLYFSRRGDPKNQGGTEDEEDIWFSEWDAKNGVWGTAKNMGTPLNNEDPNFINSISPDGNTILLGNSYLKDGTMEDGVSTSVKMGTGWSLPRRLMIEDDKNISLRTNYFQSNSGKILMLSNERKKDTYGSRDLYVSFLNADTTWSKPLNLGKTINTNGTEAAPFLAADDKTLYFTSDGLTGYGGSDIYMSRRLDNTWLHWSTPENLGPIVNTSFDESYLTVSASGSKVYFTSQARNDEDVDMYMLTLPKVLKPLPVMLMSGKVINSKTNEIVPDVKIFFENLQTGVEVGTAKSNSMNGFYQMVLPSGANYAYLAQKQGYVSVHSHIDLREMKEYKEYYKDLYITPIEIGQTIVLNNLFFDFDKYDLKPASFYELDRLGKILMSNPSMKIEVAAYADNVGTVIYNDVLTAKRATAVVDYLLKIAGVTVDRITMKHFGESNPIATNKTAKGRKLNRRVEFKILEINL